MPDITLYSRSNNFTINSDKTILYSRSNNFIIDSQHTKLYSRSNNFTINSEHTKLYSRSNNFTIDSSDPWIPGYIHNFNLNTGNLVSYSLESEFEKSYGIKYDFVISSAFLNNIIAFNENINSRFLNNYVLENFDLTDNFISNYQNVFFGIASSFNKTYDESIKPPNENCYDFIIDGESVDSNQISNDKKPQNTFSIFMDYYITKYNNFSVVILNIEKIIKSLSIVSSGAVKYDNSLEYQNQLNSEISTYKNSVNITESFLDFNNFIVKNKDDVEINVNAVVNYTDKTMSFYIDNNIKEISIEYRSNNDKGKYKIGRFDLLT